MIRRLVRNDGEGGRPPHQSRGFLALDSTTPAEILRKENLLLRRYLLRPENQKIHRPIPHPPPHRLKAALLPPLDKPPPPPYYSTRSCFKNMSDQISKTYDPASIEAPIYKMWLDEKCFHPQPTDPGKPYCIVIPPPNVTGALHLGHAINNTLQDVLIRVHRMRGFNTLWMPGIDHAGIATQAVVEKQLKEKENKTRHDVGREGLVERIWKWKQEYGDRILEQLKRMGCSCDWDRTRFTLDDQCAKAVRETFFKLFKDGLIYRGKRLVNWDIHLQTSISDDEIYHETVKTNLWHIRYPIVSSTARPLPPRPTLIPPRYAIFPSRYAGRGSG